MKLDNVYFDEISTFDAEIFTKELVAEWKTHIMNSYQAIYKELSNKIDHVFPLQFQMDESLLNEVVVDAIIGLRKVTDSTNNSVNKPNIFKIAAYLSYWFLRHKPLKLFCDKDNPLDSVKIINRSENSDEENEFERKKTAWQLKHINEIVAVQLVCTYLFDFEVSTCSQKHFEQINNCSSYGSFEESREAFLKKLTYYFAYRTIAPKVIEQILETCVFHPAWKLTLESKN